MIYFQEGELVYSCNDVSVYEMTGSLFLEVGTGHNLWALEDEHKDYENQFLQRNPYGNVAEVGLGLGIASQLLMNYPIQKLTTIELNPFVIDAYQTTLPMLNKRKWNNKIKCKHNIVNENAFSFFSKCEDKYDFIFLDFYKAIDQDSIIEIRNLVQIAKWCLTNKGSIIGWLDPYTEEEYCSEFREIFNEV